MLRQSRPLMILTRPEAAARRFAADLAQHLHRRHLAMPEVLFSPLMHPEALPDPLPHPLPATPPAGVIFTTETGVASLSARVDWRRPAICVGPQTALVAETLGWPARALGGDAARMVALLQAAPLQGHWLHARGEDAAAPLAALLGGLGMSVSEAILYRQAPLPLSPEARAQLKSHTRPVVLPVFSPRSGRLLVANLREKPAAPLWLAAISANAAHAVEPLSPLRVEIAETPDGPGMLRAVEKHLSSAA